MAPPLLPHKVDLSSRDYIFGGTAPDIEIRSGITVFVGPNGSGKTHILKQLKNSFAPRLGNLKARFLSAGRSSPLENFRASVLQPHGRSSETAYLGHNQWAGQWADYESVTADFLALSERADLRLKVEARLQTFFSRRLSLIWSQNGLQVKLVPEDGGPSYGANDEASGVLQVAALLAAIYDDRVGVLIIDEPEISLHPQFQAFILNELLSVSGDPHLDPTKKIIIFATHSEQMLPMKKLNDIANLIFFTERSALPIQLSAADPRLTSVKLAALISRLTVTHLLAFFAKTVLVVEGPTDELVTNNLAARMKIPLLATSVQVVPVKGKTEIIEATKFFQMLGKRVVVLADVDAVLDAPDVVNYFNTHPETVKQAAYHGVASLIAIDKPLRDEFAKSVDANWTKISSIAEQHRYWRDCEPSKRGNEAKRRAVLASLLSEKSAALIEAAPVFENLKARYEVLLELLKKGGCFFLRKGVVEDYYIEGDSALSKFELAVNEVDSFSTASDTELAQRYKDMLEALRTSAGNITVDENKLLRERLGAALGTAQQVVMNGMSDPTLNTSASAVLRDGQGIFWFGNLSSEKEKRLRVEIKSSLFQRATFPFEISDKENATVVIPEKLPSPSNQ